jgi:peptidoglycan/xylan/chitin deacetylase (PgdA/CDA1 family)
MRHLLPLIALTIAGTSFTVIAAEDTVRIANWQGDRAGAFAFTFDDGQREQAAIAAPMLDALGLKATFVINPGKTPQNGESWFGTWEQWRTLAKNGHEIGNHAMTHENLSKASDEVLQREVVEAKALIEKEMGLPCYTFVYPFNAEGDAARALVKKTHPVWSSGERKAYGGPQFTAAKANAWIDEAIAQKSLVIAMIHGIDSGYLPFAGRAIFKDHLDYVKSKEAQVWVAPLATIKRYAAERDAAKLDVQAGAKKAVITLTCTLDPKIYNVPLTVVIANGGAKTVSAKRAGDEVAATISGDHILCEIVPGAEPVTVTWK